MKKGLMLGSVAIILVTSATAITSFLVRKTTARVGVPLEHMGPPSWTQTDDGSGKSQDYVLQEEEIADPKTFTGTLGRVISSNCEPKGTKIFIMRGVDPYKMVAIKYEGQFVQAMWVPWGNQ